MDFQDLHQPYPREKAMVVVAYCGRESSVPLRSYIRGNSLPPGHVQGDIDFARSRSVFLTRRQRSIGLDSPSTNNLPHFSLLMSPYLTSMLPILTPWTFLLDLLQYQSQSFWMTSHNLSAISSEFSDIGMSYKPYHPEHPYLPCRTIQVHLQILWNFEV